MNDAPNESSIEFEQAMGESFGDSIESEDASPHECCEVLWAVLGKNLTPRQLSQLTETQVAALSRKFGEYFECESPALEKIREAIASTLARWPVGSLGE